MKGYLKGEGRRGRELIQKGIPRHKMYQETIKRLSIGTWLEIVVVVVVIEMLMEGKGRPYSRREGKSEATSSETHCPVNSKDLNISRNP